MHWSAINLQRKNMSVAIDMSAQCGALSKVQIKMLHKADQSQSPQSFKFLREERWTDLRANLSTSCASSSSLQAHWKPAKLCRPLKWQQEQAGASWNKTASKLDHHRWGASVATWTWAYSSPQLFWPPTTFWKAQPALSRQVEYLLLSVSFSPFVEIHHHLMETCRNF